MPVQPPNIELWVRVCVRVRSTLNSKRGNNSIGFFSHLPVPVFAVVSFSKAHGVSSKSYANPGTHEAWAALCTRFLCSSTWPHESTPGSLNLRGVDPQSLHSSACRPRVPQYSGCRPPSSPFFGLSTLGLSILRGWAKPKQILGLTRHGLLSARVFCARAHGHTSLPPVPPFFGASSPRLSISWIVDRSRGSVYAGILVFLCRPLSSSLSSPVFLCRPLSSSFLKRNIN